MKALFAVLMLTTAAQAQTASGGSKPWELPSDATLIPIIRGACTDPSGKCPMPESKVRSYLDDEEIAKIAKAVARELREQTPSGALNCKNLVQQGMQLLCLDPK